MIFTNKMFMNKLLIGNFILLIACVIMTIAGLPKKKSFCLILQNTQIFIASIGNIILGSYPGCIINILSIIRNWLSQKSKLTLPLKIILSVFVIVLSLYFNNIGFLVVFPLLSFLSFIFFLNETNDITFKILVIISCLFWAIHDFAIQAYVAGMFDIITIITNVIGIYKIRKGYEKKSVS